MMKFFGTTACDVIVSFEQPQALLISNMVNSQGDQHFRIHSIDEINVYFKRSIDSKQLFSKLLLNL